jgi:hypothetical protein
MVNKSLLFTVFRLKNKVTFDADKNDITPDSLFKYSKDRYFRFLKSDILNLNDAKIRRYQIKKQFLIGDKKSIELEDFYLTMLIFPEQQTGFFLFDYHWTSTSNDPLSEIAHLYELRYLGIEDNRSKTKDNVVRSNNLIKIKDTTSEYTWYDIIKSEFSNAPNLLENIEFYSNKLGRLHLIDNNSIDLNNEEFFLKAYNAIRIVGKNTGESSNVQSDMTLYTDPRIKSLAMNEGFVIFEKGLTANKLHEKYAPILYLSIITKLAFTDISYRLLAFESEIRINPRKGVKKSDSIDSIRELRKYFLLIKFSSKVPISNYNEIEKMRAYFLQKFCSDIDFEMFSDSLEDLFAFLQDERDREDSNRNEKMSLILGVLGITGFISFIFDYIFVKGEVRLIDYLNGPTTWLPILSFFLVTVLFYPLIKKR